MGNLITTNYATNSKFIDDLEEPPEFPDEHDYEELKGDNDMARKKKTEDTEMMTDFEIENKVQENIDAMKPVEEVTVDNSAKPTETVEESNETIDNDAEEERMEKILDERHSAALLRAEEERKEDRKRDSAIFSRGLWKGRREGFFEGIVVGIVVTVLVEVFTLLIDWII